VTPSTRCPGCGRHRNVRRDGCFVKHTVSGFFGGEWVTRPCSHSETSAEIHLAELALSAAELRATIRRKVVDNRLAARARVIADYDAATEAARGVADYCDAEVTKARAALDALRGAT
jgi:hypothetical protein